MNQNLCILVKCVAVAIITIVVQSQVTNKGKDLNEYK